ncbi:PilX N-terminal domain-containing pilus assembly protein [Ramlibacter sp. AN1015]|uniref:pilus assembly PilX family protein n=1 Tax=Ramlibacter sp. AN1015 TaxID=3133428 RepID=UPI0030BF26B0
MLVVSLVILLVILVLATAGVRLTASEEKMAGHSYDRTLAFQAAEGALREIEGRVALTRPTAAGACADVPGDGFSVLTCPPPAGNDKPRWADASFTQWGTASPIGIDQLSITPTYVVEYLGASFPCSADPTDPPACKRYRITARANAGPERAAVTVQSIYATD